MDRPSRGGYSHILTNIVPKMLLRGITENGRDLRISSADASYVCHVPSGFDLHSPHPPEDVPYEKCDGIWLIMWHLSHLKLSWCFKHFTQKPIVLVVKILPSMWHVYLETLNKHYMVMIKILLNLSRDMILIPCARKFLACDIYDSS